MTTRALLLQASGPTGGRASGRLAQSREHRRPKGYNFLYSALALFRIGTSGSASFQGVRNAS